MTFDEIDELNFIIDKLTYIKNCNRNRQWAIDGSGKLAWDSWRVGRSSRQIRKSSFMAGFEYGKKYGKIKRNKRK